MDGKKIMIEDYENGSEWISIINRPVQDGKLKFRIDVEKRERLG